MIFLGTEGRTSMKNIVLQYLNYEAYNTAMLEGGTRGFVALLHHQNFDIIIVNA
jgi:hypothetical protein